MMQKLNVLKALGVSTLGNNLDVVNKMPLLFSKKIKRKKKRAKNTSWFYKTTNAMWKEDKNVFGFDFTPPYLKDEKKSIAHSHYENRKHDCLNRRNSFLTHVRVGTLKLR